MVRITASCGLYGDKVSVFFKYIAFNYSLFYMLLSQILFNIPVSKLEFLC